MVRPRRARRISYQPKVRFFKPAGVQMRELKEKVLSFDEVEAVRHVDYEKKGQKEAAIMMDVSQSTLSRLLKDARSKMANAIVEGHALRIQGGDYFLESVKTNAGRMGGLAKGPGGRCVCPECYEEIEHKRGKPCYDIVCLKCANKMVRKSDDERRRKKSR